MVTAATWDSSIIAPGSHSVVTTPADSITWRLFNSAPHYSGAVALYMTRYACTLQTWVHEQHVYWHPIYTCKKHKYISNYSLTSQFNRITVTSHIIVQSINRLLAENMQAGHNVSMGVTRKFSREGHNFQAKNFLAFFAQKVKKKKRQSLPF